MSAIRPPLSPRRFGLFPIVAVALLLPSAGIAQIVNSATGQIDLKLSPFFTGNPAQQLISPVGLADASASINGKGYYSVGGLNEVEFNHLTTGPAQTWFTTYASAHSDNEPNGGGGHAKLDLSFYAQAPFYYRFEADVIECFSSYRVTFNGTEAVAFWDHSVGFPDGTFPLLYSGGGSPVPVGWDTYIDEGFLPAGLYDFSVESFSGLMHGFGQPATGTASLLIQMQGDADLDGFVGLGDLDIVLANWNDYVPAGAVQFGDLTRDGVVGLDDLDQILANWNASVVPPALVVPEPVMGVLVAAGGLVVLARRRLLSRPD